jgi:hypothetical protein
MNPMNTAQPGALLASAEQSAATFIRLFSEHSALIIDPLADEPPLIDLARYPNYSLAPGQLKHEHASLPVLVQTHLIAPADQGRALEALEQRMARGRPPGFSAFVDTKGEIGAVVSSLRRCAVLRDAADASLHAFRFHDPRVMQQLRWVMLPAQLRLMLHRVRRWTYVLDGHFVQIDTEQMDTERLADDGAIAPAINAGQCATIHRLELINAATAALVRAGMPDAWQKGYQIDSALLKATALHRLHRREDLIDYACCALRVHERFDEHATVRKALDARTDEDSFADLFGQMTEDQWSAIRAELSR